MPKFNDKEKEMIQHKLRIEGERLFTAYGLKKVTVNDLVQAVGISHGAFYAFYENKEHLFMEINVDHQIKIFGQIENILIENKPLPPRELTRLVIKHLLDAFLENPIISLINIETWESMERKLPQSIVEKNNMYDIIALEKLIAYGVKLKCPVSVAVKVVQVLLVSASRFIRDEEGTIVIDVLLEGIIDQIIEE
ncbi:MAG: TetR/AcrR family transcriptional regulator [Firmicutes bacterium HGW-Firmicutes-1]|jgi:AcrR family transcriptional regulator|nr:MAG: TetR/AcrR family transcriptional regulator [Firmicutes bacterium HGW-Firmicutes-1]